MDKQPKQNQSPKALAWKRFRSNKLGMVSCGFVLLWALLALFAYLLAVAIGLVFGILAAVFHNKWIDKLLMILAVGGISAPNFWVAIILQIYFGDNPQNLPVAGIFSKSARRSLASKSTC